MAWFNPSTWSPVDALQNSISSIGYNPTGPTPVPGYGGFTSSPVTVPHAAAPTAVSPGGDPQQLAQNATQNAASQPNATGGGAALSGGAVAPAGPTPEQLAVINQQQGFLQSALNRLPTQLGIAQGNIQGNYNTNLNELNSGQQQAQQSYNQGTNQNTQQFVTNKNQITDKAASGLHSLLRLLGMRGAGGSSDALYSAPGAVAQVASQEKAGAGQNFGQNQQGLDANWNNYENGFNQSKQKLSDWLSQSLNSAQSQNDTAQQGLLQQIAGIQPSTALAQPFLDQSSALNDQVDQLAKLNPTYNGTSPTYTAPSISSYTVNPTAPVQAAANAQQSATASPFLSLLFGNQKNKTQPGFNF